MVLGIAEEAAGGSLWKLHGSTNLMGLMHAMHVYIVCTCIPACTIMGPAFTKNIYICIYIYILINIGLGHLAWDMIWACGPMGPGPGAGEARRGSG